MVAVRYETITNCAYEFSDRLQGFWDDWNEQVLHKARNWGRLWETAWPWTEL